MNIIDWVGYSFYWRHERAIRPVFRFPLVEEAILDVATGNLRHLSEEAALRCICRPLFRESIENLGANPRWARMPWFSPVSVIKAPGSVENRGVAILAPGPYSSRLPKEHQAQAVVEEFVEGEQYEVDGCIIGGEVMLFHPVRQHWADGRIIKYERVCSPPHGFYELVNKVLAALGLDDCPFCIEARWTGHRWVVIEVNPRLGEDDGLAAAISDSCPLEEIGRFAARHRGIR